MLYQNIKYDYFCLKRPIIINGVLIREIYFNPYWEKHQKEGISKELIIELVKLLELFGEKELGIGKRYDEWVYYNYEPIFYQNKAYCLVWCLEDKKNYIEIVDCYRESNYERPKNKVKYGKKN